MRTLIQDLRHGARMLAKTPGATMIAMLTLALGIGANIAMFSVVNALLLRPLPFPREQQLMVLRESKAGEPDNPLGDNGVSYLNFSDWRAQSRSFDSMAIVQTTGMTLTGEGEPVRATAAVVSADLFRVLDRAPALGRAFTATDEQPGGAAGLRAVMLGYECWRTRFGADPRVTDRSIRLDNQAYQIIGVAPAGIFPLREEPVEFWITTAYGGAAYQQGTMNGSRGYRAYIAALGRLRADVTPERAQAELDGIARGLAEKHPDSNRDHIAHVYPLRGLLTGPVKPLLWLLLGVVGAVLLIACANVANLLLARAATRRREIAIRAALGATRWRIARQLLTESLLLSLGGAVLGIVVSLWAVDLLLWLAPAGAPRVTGLAPDWRVALFALAAALVTGILCGLAPALLVSRTDLAGEVREGGRQQTGGRGQRYVRGALVIGQIAVAMILLAGAGLLLRSFIKLNQSDPGFPTQNLLTASIVLADTRYEKDENRLAFYEQLAPRLRALPGVADVSLAQSIPLTPNDNGTSLDIVGRPYPRGQEPEARLRFIGLDYFRTIGVPGLAGRDFSAADNARARPVVIVNEAFARRFFPGENPLGRQLKPGWGGDAPKEIVGVYANVRHRWLGDQPRPEMYVPLAQFPAADMTILLRTRVAPEALTSALGQTIHELDAQLPVTDVKTLEQYRGETMALPRFNTFVLLTFATLALSLSLIGLYGTLSYSVAQRTREMGIRLALGARTRDVLWMVIRQGMALVLAGLVIGLAAALALTRAVTSLLYEISPADPLTYATLALLLLAVSLLACWLPARRATRVDPMIALRCE
ncbi:MAG: ABC transporter permease [Blastocatellia bacterium]